mgnify:CR=1 FL=1
MFKKLISAVAAAALCVSLAACGANSSDKNTSSSNDVQRLPVKLPLKQPPPRTQLLPKPRPKRLPALKLLTVPCALPA